jgi:transposase-like protein
MAMVRSKAIHIALGVRADGGKEVLGLWSSRTKAPASCRSYEGCSFEAGLRSWGCESNQPSAERPE